MARKQRTGNILRIAKRPIYVRLKKDVNCIPAGIYRLRPSKEKQTYRLSVGPEISLFVATTNDSLFERVTLNGDSVKATSVDEFLPRYYELLNNQRKLSSALCNLFVPSEALTGAAISPQLAARFENCDSGLH